VGLLQHARRSSQGRAAVRPGRRLQPAGPAGEGAPLFRPADRGRAGFRPGAEGGGVARDRDDSEERGARLRRLPQVKTATWAYWRRILAGNILASLAVVFAFSGAT